MSYIQGQDNRFQSIQEYNDLLFNAAPFSCDRPPVIDESVENPMAERQYEPKDIPSYNPYFKYEYYPEGTGQNENFNVGGVRDHTKTPQCIGIPEDLSKCYNDSQRTKGVFAHQPIELLKYNKGKPVLYENDPGVPLPVDNFNSGYFPVKNLGEVSESFHNINQGILRENCGYKTQDTSDYSVCNKTNIEKCTPGFKEFETCDKPDLRFGSAESIYRMYGKDAYKYKNYKWWKNLSQTSFINDGEFNVVTKQNWTSAPWALNEYATTRCEDDNNEEWRTSKDRCSGEYKYCHNLFNNMTKRKSLY